MTDLIKVEVKKGIETVNARDLWKFLEVGKDFSTWIKDKIEKYEFVKGEDFITVHKNGERTNTGQEAIEYFLTLDMGKELAMVQNNKKGREIRKYFIALEKTLNSKKALRGETKAKRNLFTDILKEHGYNAPHHYIQTTLQMKGVLGIAHKKDEMTEDELGLIMASEIIAAVNLKNSQAEGYYEVNPICLNSSLAVKNVTQRKLA